MGFNHNKGEPDGYDDDITVSLENMAQSCEMYRDNHKALSDLTLDAEILLNNVIAVMNEAATFIEENI